MTAKVAATATVETVETAVVGPGPLTGVVITKSTHILPADSIGSASGRQFMIGGKDAVMVVIGPGTATALSDGILDATMMTARLVVSVIHSKIVVLAEAVEVVVTVVTVETASLAEAVVVEVPLLRLSAASLPPTSLVLCPFSSVSADKPSGTSSRSGMRTSRPNRQSFLACFPCRAPHERNPWTQLVSRPS